MRLLFSTRPVSNFIAVCLCIACIPGTTTGNDGSLVCVHKDSCGGGRNLEGFEVTYYCRCNHGMSGSRCEHTFHHPTSHRAKVFTGSSGDAPARTKIAVRVDGHGDGYASLEGDQYCYNVTSNCLHGAPVYHNHPLCSELVTK
ncbi:hypothetical protein AAVH_39173 [Aphelenchoides avenae]|nr:hypothetical protein AAVH_39173 [Aphelenchus avenae]